MQQLFDYFGKYELPYIILTNPNKEELYSLGLAYDINIITRFNALGELTFKFPQSIDGGQTVLEPYDYIQNKRLVKVENVGYFVIVDAEEDLTGFVPVKNVSCKSLEFELVGKRVTAYGGTVKLWDALDTTGTLLQSMIDLAPNWTVNHVDASLMTKYRTFDISDSNVYNLLMSYVEDAFECVFLYDTNNRTISAYALENVGTVTDIFLSFDNLVKNIKFSEKSDEITTCLSVYGGGTLNIRLVNPLGTDKIYDFSYYTNSGWMSAELISAINAWTALVNSLQTSYADNLTLLSQYNAELLILQAHLATLNEDYLAIQGIQKVRIQTNQPYDDINILLASKQSEIDSQNVLIANKQTQISNTTSDLLFINQQVSFSNNFTPQQLLELDNFMFENTYQNENIIQTDTMTAVEIQAAAQSLYNQGKNVLAKVSQPRYEIDIDSTNYIYLSDYSIFTNQTDVGNKITVETKSGTLVEVVLLELKYSPLNPTDFSMTFSNRLRLDNGNYIYSDLQGKVQNVGSKVNFSDLKWSNWENNYKDAVSTFITSALDTTTNNLISNSNQEILINQNGLRAKNYDGAGYSPKQAWLVNNVLAFSDDGFQTSKLALGEITLAGGGTAYGLVADTIVGRLLAGTTLTISNSNNNFLLDESGAYLTNATLTIGATNSRIFLDPTNGIKIQALEGGNWVDKFYVDGTGNVNFAGNLTGATGTFSGTLSASVGNIGTLVIDSLGLKTADGVNYLRGDGSLKWGGLTISGSGATFSGTIYADKLQGQIVNTQVATGLDAAKVTVGSMSGSRIFSGTLGGNGVSIGLGTTGIPTITGTDRVLLRGGASGYLYVGDNPILYAPNAIQIQGASINLVVGSFKINSVTGLSGTYSISTSTGMRSFTFYKGILTQVT